MKARQRRSTVPLAANVPQASRLPRPLRFLRNHTLQHKVLSKTNRLIFMGMWTALLTGLLVFPGFEVRGLAAGLIVGYWLVSLTGELYELMNHQPMVLFFLMFILSGATVFLCAWLIDKAKGIALSRTILIGSILIAAAWFTIDGITYRQWQRTSPIQQAMASPEVDYQPAYSDFCRAIVIPRALAGGMIGLYIATGTCAIAAQAKLVLQAIRNRLNPEHPTQGDSHGRNAPCTTKHTA